jgi:hypothetical protein
MIFLPQSVYPVHVTGGGFEKKSWGFIAVNEEFSFSFFFFLRVFLS